MASYVSQLFRVFDDGISGHRDKVSARVVSLVQRSDLSSSGLVQNESKSRWEPVQVGKWLGFLINTVQHIFQVPEAKLAKLNCLLESLILDGFSTPKQLARVAGLLPVSLLLYP